MRIAIHTQSGACRRSLEAIVTAAGHEAVETGAELTLSDTATSTGDNLPTLNLTPLIPIRPHTLIQRLAMLEQTQHVAIGSWALDVPARTLTHESGESLTLTEKEASLLKSLTQAHPASLTREALLTQVWGIASSIDTHTLETHIYRLRNKFNSLKTPFADIETEGGAYRLAIK